MPKARTRHTCTECSRRRQQCDRQIPCSRCVKRGVPERCQLDWPEDYDPAKHRIYPSSRPRGGSRMSSLDENRHVTTEVDDASVSHMQTPAGGSLDYTFTPFQDAQLRKADSTSTCSEFERFIQTLMPDVEHIWLLVDYHEQYLLWYHCCYHGPTFRHELRSLLASQGNQSTLEARHVKMQWLALLFAIMAGSLACASEMRLSAWGFSHEEVTILSMQWFKASVQCLNHGNWTSEHSILSIQAVTTLTMAAPSLGQSAELSILLGAAIRIACALGLDRLAYDAATEDIRSTSTATQRHHMLRRDMGRKLWSQLCVQDWLSVPVFSSHGIQPNHFTSTRPSSRSHVTMEHIPETFPTYISYGNYIFDIAKLVVQHHDATLAATTPFTRYRHVVDYGTRMRELATNDIPEYFRVTQPVDASWPAWIYWARSSLTVCFAHKIIMIHRDYILQSFTNPAYNTTRVTCVAAAKTILNEAQQQQDNDGPIIWIDVCFCITAALVLCLDIAHRTRADPEFATHQRLVSACLTQLESCTNIVADKGVTIINALLAQHDLHPQGGAGGSVLLQIAEKPIVAPGDRSFWADELLPPLAGFSNAFMRQTFFSDG